MIISRTPFRISFFGGGTDYPDWYLKEGGAVLSTTIDKYCYLNCRYLPPFFDIKHQIVWSRREAVASISEIAHPAVREGLKFLGFDDSLGLEIHHQGDLPARAGMGSSSSFIVGLIHALSGLKNRVLHKQELALKAIELEQAILKETVGSQDQVATAYGGLNVIEFFKNGTFQIEPLAVPPQFLDELQSRLMLFFTGSNRVAAEVAFDVVAHLSQKREELKRMRSMVDEAASILSNGKNLDDFGRLLHEGWMLKRELSRRVTSPVVDWIYKKALAEGALGGKLLGAGGAGFMVFYVPLEAQQAVRDALSNYLYVPFKFELEGSRIIYNERDGFNPLSQETQGHEKKTQVQCEG